MVGYLKIIFTVKRISVTTTNGTKYRENKATILITAVFSYMGFFRG